MACLISQMRQRLTVHLCRSFLSDVNSHFASSYWRNEFKKILVQPRVLCTNSSSSIRMYSSSTDQELGRRKSNELEAENILKNLSEDDKVKLERLKNEYESWKIELRMVPSEVRSQDWVSLLEKKTKSSRKKFYQYLATTELKILNAKQKKEQKRLAREKKIAEEGTEQESRSYIAHISHKKLRNRRGKMTGYQSMMFGNPVVIDFSVGFQSVREAKNLFMQLNDCYAANKSHPEPFHMHYTGLPQTGPVAEEFKWALQSLDNSFIDCHTEEVHEVFPRDKLVYLTPNSRKDLEYNGDDVYVIGALVDLHDTKPYTFAKAKKLQLRTACLPLDKFYRLKKLKSLPLDIVYKVMLDLNYTRDWEKAMIHIPTRYWADVRTPKLRRYWKEKLEQQRQAKERRLQEEYDDSRGLDLGLENTDSNSETDIDELNSRSRFKL